MSNYDPPSIPRLALVIPALRVKVYAAMDELAPEGDFFRVASGLRDYPEQEKLFQQGRTLPGPIVTHAHGGYSNHNFGCAVDCFPFLVGSKGALEMNDHTNPKFVRMVAALKAQGLAWGGDWSEEREDFPHFQLANVPVTPTVADRTAFDHGGLVTVWAQYREV